jgi:hypothetical protein
MIAQVSREKNMASWPYVLLSTLNRTRAVHDGNDANNPEWMLLIPAFNNSHSANDPEIGGGLLL